MNSIRRHPVIILLLGVVLLAPFYELIDQGRDMEQGSDLVLTLLWMFMVAGQFWLCKRVICVLARGVLSIIAADTSLSARHRSIRIDVSPPECLRLIGSLRI